MSQDIFNSCMEIVKAQAAVRNMTAEEIAAMMDTLVSRMGTISKGLSSPTVAVAEAVETEIPAPLMSPKASIRELHVVCLECGEKFKMLTKRHLAMHGMTPAQYREKFGFKKGASLTAKGLSRARRKKMQDMKLWERKKSAVDKAAVSQGSVKPATKSTPPAEA